MYQSGQECPASTNNHDLQGGPRGRGLPCINNNRPSNDTLKECCLGCRLGQMYRRNPMMCTDISSNMISGFLKESFLECCNVTEGIIESSSNIHRDDICPDGFAFNPQGRYNRFQKYYER